MCIVASTAFKNSTHIFLAKPPLNMQTAQAPILGTPLPLNQIFYEPQKN